MQSSVQISEQYVYIVRYAVAHLVKPVWCRPEGHNLIPSRVIDIFLSLDPGHTIALGSTHPLTGMSTVGPHWEIKAAAALG
jgi:hypothetical protein